METYRPVMTQARIVKFNRQQLEELLERLEDSGAAEIGVDITREN